MTPLDGFAISFTSVSLRRIWSIKLSMTAIPPCKRPSMHVGGPQEKTSGPILSIPIYLKTCLYCPCKFSLKKNDPFLTYEPPKVSVFFVVVTGLVTQLASLLKMEGTKVHVGIGTIYRRIHQFPLIV
jgi:hypothetical protein